MRYNNVAHLIFNICVYYIYIYLHIHSTYMYGCLFCTELGWKFLGFDTVLMVFDAFLPFPSYQTLEVHVGNWTHGLWSNCQESISIDFMVWLMVKTTATSCAIRMVGCLLVGNSWGCFCRLQGFRPGRLCWWWDGFWWVLSVEITWRKSGRLGSAFLGLRPGGGQVGGGLHHCQHKLSWNNAKSDMKLSFFRSNKRGFDCTHLTFRVRIKLKGHPFWTPWVSKSILWVFKPDIIFWCELWMFFSSFLTFHSSQVYPNIIYEKVLYI